MNSKGAGISIFIGVVVGVVAWILWGQTRSVSHSISGATDDSQNRGGILPPLIFSDQQLTQPRWLDGIGPDVPAPQFTWKWPDVLAWFKPVPKSDGIINRDYTSGGDICTDYKTPDQYIGGVFIPGVTKTVCTPKV